MRLLVNRILTVLVVSCVANLASAQDLGVDTNWRKFSNSRPRSERITIAQDAINMIMPQLGDVGEFNGIGYWQSGNVWSALAIQDQLTGTQTNKAQVVNNLKLVFKLRKNYDQFGYYNDDALWWATAALYAHNTYNDLELLNNAIATWESVSRFVISTTDSQQNKHPLKNFTLAGTCDGVTMAGGVFWRPTTDDSAINSITTGYELGNFNPKMADIGSWDWIDSISRSLSAYLAEVTKQTKYKDAAILSATWIIRHNLNSGNIVLDTVSGANCGRSPSNWIFTYNSGKFIEGLSVLTDITGDKQWETHMITTLAAAVKNTAWQGADGIITEGSDNSTNNDGIGFKAVFIRGLLEAFRRTPENTKLRILIHSYVDVQYNALLDLARTSNFYSANWKGPAPTQFTSWGQLAALDVLVSAVEAN